MRETTAKLRTLWLLAQAPPPAPRPRPMPLPRPAPPPGAPAPRPYAPPPPGMPPAPPPGVAPPPAPGVVPPPAGDTIPGAAPLPGEIPAEEKGPAPRINIEGRFPKVTMLKWVGMGWLFGAAVLAMVFNHVLLTDGEGLLNMGLGYGLLGAGIAMGLIAFLNEDWRRWMSYLSTFAIIGGIAARPIVTPLVTYDIVYVAPAALFAFAFFMYLEFLDAYQRFTDVGRMAVERNLQSFNLNQVVNHFLVWGFMLAAIFMASSLLVLSLVTQGFAALLGPELANSVEVQAVFGQAMAILVVFTLIAVVLTFLFVFLERKTDVEQVAYSREQIRGMVEQGGQPGAKPGPAGPQGPAAPGAPGGRPPTPRGTTPGLAPQR